ncbi:RNA polymerase sigma factor [Alcaligenes faecalis]|jgi:RNA polymerase sigma-70 factor (ECF subfamily)|uniref:RNA polymerase sigma factor n=1 Tax=Alcaligenes faecalis TaxID=511 RepID=A0ABY7N2K3_ALCFA|nr:RNA polymerase sigma factor [Alcaligenes faecalis]WBM37838.1 RNA polymerase sigma factor [Alcaligenes faecalis]
MLSTCLPLPTRKRNEDCVTPQYSLCLYLKVHYEELLRQLTIRLRCRDRATDALHDTWLRLHGSREIGPVANPRLYLLRMASNLAIDEWRAESGRGTLVSLDELEEHQQVSPMPGPESSLIGRSLLSVLIYAIELLPRQRRAIFLAARLEEQSLSVVAERFGVTTSKARNELRRAEAHCEQALLGNWAELRQGRNTCVKPPPTMSAGFGWMAEPVGF